MPGGGGDAYLQGGWGSTLDPAHRRVAKETYWNIRRHAASVRDYLERSTPADKRGPRYMDLWLIAESVDLVVHARYLAGGVPGVDYALDHEDALEHQLSRLGAERNYIRTGDYQAYLSVLTSKPAADADILPSWSVDAAREYSRNVARQKNVKSRDSDDSQDGDGARRRRNRRRPATGSAAGGGGGSGSAASSSAAPRRTSGGGAADSSGTGGGRGGKASAVKPVGDGKG